MNIIMNHFLSGVLDSSLIYSVGFIGFVSGNIAYYNLFYRHSWMYKYMTLLPSAVSMGTLYYLYMNSVPETTANFSYIAGAVLPHFFVMRNINILHEFTK